MSNKKAIIIGAGPAGLTAAFELLKRSDIQPIIFESAEIVGGIARTINYRGNRIDVGGHRFFSKSARVMAWWLSILPLQRPDESCLDYAKTVLNGVAPYTDAQNVERGLDPNLSDRVMLIRKRLSRILFRRKLFDYPLSLSAPTLRNLGVASLVRIAGSYMSVKLFPVKNENTLEDFFINRFGGELYRTFFKDYTEKVWGIPCKQIKPDWGAQRVKGLSIAKAVSNAFSRLIHKNSARRGGTTETSLIEYFLYPKYGPGQMWEEVAAQIQEKGSDIFLRHTVVGMNTVGTNIKSVRVRNETTGEDRTIDADYVFSSMPVRDLILGLGDSVPSDVRRVAEELRYRDFLTIGLLFSRLNTPDGTLPDNWIYVQESDVKVGRIQVFNNWSPYLVQNPKYTWLGLEYFCQEGDDLWMMAESDLIKMGIKELHSLGLGDPENFLDGIVLRMPKAYPAYFGGYEHFDLIRNYVDRIDNLFLIGRNGMHKYNNMDHSMLTAMTAVDNILGNVRSNENLWKVNTEADYHEEKHSS